MLKKESVHGYLLNYDDENCREGLNYLRAKLSHTEAQVFFDQARMRREAEFEDPQNRQFTLKCEGGIYTLIRR